MQLLVTRLLNPYDHLHFLPILSYIRPSKDLPILNQVIEKIINALLTCFQYFYYDFQSINQSFTHQRDLPDTRVGESQVSGKVGQVMAGY